MRIVVNTVYDFYQTSISRLYIRFMSIFYRLGVGNVQSLRPDLARKVKNRPIKA